MFLCELRLLLDIKVSSFHISAVTLFGSVIGQLCILIELSAEERRRELFCSDFGHRIQGLSEHELKSFGEIRRSYSVKMQT